MNVITRTTCRSCGFHGIVPVFDLGPMHISNFLENGQDPGPPVPLTLVRCGKCTLVQLVHTVDQDELYRKKYWYLSGTNASMRDALKDVVDDALAHVELKPDDVIVDIGSNDGTLLNAYPGWDTVRRGDTYEKYGFEPSPAWLQDKSRQYNLIEDYFTAKYWPSYTKKKATIITAIAMFYDLEDPNKFVQDVRDILAPNGIFIIQMAYLGTMLQRNDFMNICHEHLEYYDLTALEQLLNRNGLKVLDAKLNDVNGGSIRVIATHLDGRRREKVEMGRVYSLREDEQIRQGTGYKAWLKFEHQVKELKKKTVEFIDAGRDLNKRFWVYGASTKGNTLLQYYGLTKDHIEYALDANPAKRNLHLPGSNIPIWGSSPYIPPDYFVVLPWHFLDGFLVRERGYLDRGGKFLVPLPELEVIETKTVLERRLL